MNKAKLLIVISYIMLLKPLTANLEFMDVTSDAGITYTQHQLPDSGSGSRPFFQTYMSGGAAAGDYDNDGYVDLYITRLDDSNILYRNKGDGTFEDATLAAFGSNHLSNSVSNGCAWGDVDNDGDLDLYVTSLFSTSYQLYINNGQGSFTQEAFIRGASVFSTDTHYGMSVTFGDYNLDGFLDIHVTEWRNDAQNPTSAPHNNRLLRNTGKSNPGHFTDVTNAAGVATDLVPTVAGFDSQGFSPRFSDIDRDGNPDLLIASDHGSSRLFWGNGDETFTDGTVAAGVGTDQFGMGSTLGDYDMDGDLDWFVTSIFQQDTPGRNGNRLYRYDGNRLFSDQTDSAGVRDGQWGWAAAFADFDHDKDLDLIQTNGADFPFNPSVSNGYENDPTRLWENDGSGSFTEVAGVSTGVTDTASGKGLLTFDYDNDGDLDVFIVNNQAGPVLYKNIGADGTNWLIIKPEGIESNKQGLGAFISVIPEDGAVPLIREVNGGSNFLGQNEVMAHYGLGHISGTTVKQITIDWPSGIVQTLNNVPINASYKVSEPLSLDATIPLTCEIQPNGDFLLEWPSTSGTNYTLEVCTNLGIPHWTTYHNVQAIGGMTSCTMPAGEIQSDGLYFRVLELAN